MLRNSVLFAVLALIAGLLGFVGLRSDLAFIARVFLFLFVLLLVLSLFFRGRPIRTMI